MKSVHEHLNENENLYQDYMFAATKEIPALVRLIQKELGFSPKIVIELQKGRNGESLKISSSDNLVKELGNTLVKAIFTEIKIDFWGGTKLTSENKIWFNPKISYTHPGGGSNGTDFLWDSLWFDLDTNKWITGRKIF